MINKEQEQIPSETPELTSNSLARRENYLQQRRSLVLLVAFRLLILAALLISTIVVHSHKDGASSTLMIPLYTVAGSFFLANLIYIVLFRLKAPFILQAVTQAVGDLLFAIVILHFTGGVQSAFSFFYLLVAINGAVIFQDRRAMLVASCTVLTYMVQITLQFYHVVEPYTVLGGSSVSSMAFLNAGLVHTFAIYAITFLTLFLAEQAQKAHNTATEIRHDLRQLKELHQAVIQNLPVGVVTLDSDGMVVLVNSLAEPLLDSQVTIGGKLETLFDKPLAAFSDGYVVTKTIAGQEQALLVRFSPLLHNADLLGNIVTLQDVTSVRQIERELHQKERLAAVGELSAGMAHEIRNPLASIRGSIEMLSRRTAKDAAEQGLMNIAVREIDRLNLLITDFLTYTRPQHLALGMVDLGAVCQDTRNLLLADLPPNINLTLSGVGSVLVEADEAKIKQVLWNLLKNSLDACQVAGRENYLIEMHLSHVGEQAILAVKDNGQGLSAATRSSLFVPFFSTKSQGSGLGLAIIKRIVDDHHGKITVSSTEGEGTTFEIVLPLKQPETNGEEAYGHNTGC